MIPKFRLYRSRASLCRSAKSARRSALMIPQKPDKIPQEIHLGLELYYAPFGRMCFSLQIQ
jgi:hypothetical protein